MISIDVSTCSETAYGLSVLCYTDKFRFPKGMTIHNQLVISLHWSSSFGRLHSNGLNGNVVNLKICRSLGPATHSRYLLLDPRDDFFQSFLQRSFALNAQDFLAVVQPKKMSLVDILHWYADMPIEVTNQMKCLKSQTVTTILLLYYDALHILCSVENCSYILPKFSRLARLKGPEMRPVDAGSLPPRAAASFAKLGALAIVSLLAHHSERSFRIAHQNIFKATRKISFKG